MRGSSPKANAEIVGRVADREHGRCGRTRIGVGRQVGERRELRCDRDREWIGVRVGSAKMRFDALHGDVVVTELKTPERERRSADDAEPQDDFAPILRIQNRQRQERTNANGSHFPG